MDRLGDIAAKAFRKPSEQQVTWQHQFTVGDLDIVCAREDISSGAHWHIYENSHALIVHIGGDMHKLEAKTNDSDGSLGPANPGEIWFVPSGTEYEGRAIGGLIDYALIQFPTEVIPQQSQGAIVSNLLSYHGRLDLAALRIVSEMSELNSQTDALSVLESRSLAIDLVKHVLNHYSDISLAKDLKYERYDLSDKVAGNLRLFIHDQLEENLSLSELSHQVNLTPHQFLEAFKAVHKTSPAQYIIDQRLRRAQWLLMNTREDITGIAFATGFSSHSHLSTTFKKRIGFTPSQFRVRALA